MGVARLPAVGPLTEGRVENGDQEAGAVREGSRAGGGSWSGACARGVRGDGAGGSPRVSDLRRGLGSRASRRLTSERGRTWVLDCVLLSPFQRTLSSGGRLDSAVWAVRRSQPPSSPSGCAPPPHFLVIRFIRDVTRCGLLPGSATFPVF